MCLPVRVVEGGDTTLKGVTCVDVTLEELFKDVTYFQEGSLSYAFIMDSRTRLLVHPLLPRPLDVEDDPIFLYLSDLEQSTEVEEIVQDMIRYVLVRLH